MATFEGCSEELKADLIAFYGGFLVHATMTTSFQGLLTQLQTKWADTTVKNSSGTDRCEGLDGFRDGKLIGLCYIKKPRVEAVLFHELVHRCGGRELDSEALEQAFFGDRTGLVTRPSGDDWSKFISETSPFNGDARLRMGTYVIWNRDTGEVWVRTKADGRDAKGTLLFTEDFWIRA